MFPKEIGQSTQMAVSPRQEALLTCSDGIIQVTLRTSFRVGPLDLAWVIPVPHPPDRVEKADDAIFTKLEGHTVPRFYAVQAGYGIGCRGNSSSSQEVGRVVVAQTGEAGIYDYTVLTATGTEVLLKWLNDHSYYVPPGAEAVFKRYVDHGWAWLAIRLNAQRCDKDTVMPHPIRYAYRDTECVYPLVISQLSADDDNEILLYVLSSSPYACKNWATETIPRERLRVDHRSKSGTNYENIFRSRTGRAGGRLFMCEYVSALTHFPEEERRYYAGLVGPEAVRLADDGWNPLFLTRLRAVVSREAMDEDVILVPDFSASPQHGRGSFGLGNSLNLPSEGDYVLPVAVMLFAGFGVYLFRRYMRRRGLSEDDDGKVGEEAS